MDVSSPSSNTEREEEELRKIRREDVSLHFRAVIRQTGLEREVQLAEGKALSTQTSTMHVHRLAECHHIHNHWPSLASNNE